MKIWGWSGWRFGVGGWLVVAALGGGAGSPLAAQVATTTVQDTVTDASGVGAAGTVVVSWEAFTTAAGSSVAAGSLSSTLGTGGALSVPLQPNAAATPMGSYYTAVFRLSDGTTSREFWVVPVSGTGTVKLASIRNQVLPTNVAMQTVSKQYVDTTVAKAMAGVAPGTGLGGGIPYILKSGDTMSGPLTLAGDPVSATQAADKHYVDAAVATAAPGGGVPTGAAGGDLGGSYPNPAVQAVHATSGTLDNIAVGGTTPAAGSFTSLASSSYSLTYTGSTAATPFTVFGPNLGTGNQICQGFGTAASSGNATYYCWYHTGTNTGYGSLETFGGSSPIRVNASNWRVDTAGNVTANAYHETLYTPASSSAACSAGDFADDTNFHYVCVAASTWKRVALAPF